MTMSASAIGPTRFGRTRRPHGRHESHWHRALAEMGLAGPAEQMTGAGPIALRRCLLPMVPMHLGPMQNSAGLNRTLPMRRVSKSFEYGDGSAPWPPGTSFSTGSASGGYEVRDLPARDHHADRWGFRRSVERDRRDWTPRCR